MSNATDQKFTATHWSAVMAARDPSSPAAREAMEKLCRAYWYPLYAYLRRKGHSPHDAQDLTQGFFQSILEKGFLAHADPAKGKFRTFLLVALNHFVADQRDRARTAKRGGGRELISLDQASAEQRFGLEPADPMDAQKLYERRWALTVLEQAQARLRAEFVAAGQEALFNRLEPLASGEKSGETHAHLAAAFGMTESAITSRVCRLRERHRELIRDVVAQTLASRGEIDEEMRQLLAVLRG